MNLAGLLLAAGSSSRLGFPKQLLRIDGATLMRRSVETLLATGSSPAVVVLGAHADRIAPELADLPVMPVTNPDWASGMASSVRAGLTEILRLAPRCDAVLLTLCDQPGVTGPDLLALVDLYIRAGKPIAASAYGEAVGVPAIFSKTLFPDLLALQGDAGARKVISANLRDTAQRSLPAGLIDVDVPADLPRAGIKSDIAPAPSESSS